MQYLLATTITNLIATKYTNALVRFYEDYRIKPHVPPYVKSRQFF